MPDTAPRPSRPQPMAHPLTEDRETRPGGKVAVAEKGHIRCDPTWRISLIVRRSHFLPEHILPAPRRYLVQERQLRWPIVATPFAVFFHHAAHPLVGDDLDRLDQRSLHSDPLLNSISDRHNPSAHNAGYCSSSLFSRSSVCRFVKQPGKQLSSRK